MSKSIHRESFGTTSDGNPVYRWDISHGKDLSIELMNYGATLRSVRWGGLEICLGLKDVAAYEKQNAYMGTTCGRFSNRIANAQFVLNDKIYSLFPNDKPHSLHGGKKGFSRSMWGAEYKYFIDDETLAEGGERWSGILFSRRSPHGEEGYPGTVDAKVGYFLSNDGYLIMYYWAQSDAPCPVNLTNHAYWNLEGEGTGHIRGHEISIAADRYVDVDAAGIPTGALKDVEGAMDMRQLRSPVLPNEGSSGSPVPPAPLSSDLPEGYDHCYVLNKTGKTAPLLKTGHRFPSPFGAISRLKPRLAAQVYVPSSGRCMEVYSSYPGMQFYTGAYLNEEAGRNGLHFKPHSAFCLEAQFFPDSPNHSPHNANFPDTILRPGEVYEQITVHRFTKRSA